MHKLTLHILYVLLLFGCTPRLITVPLNPPNIQESQVNVVVKNGRLDQQIYLTEFGFDGTSYIRMLDPEPAIEVALRQFVEEKLIARKSLVSLSKIEVTIERLDLKNKVGTARADELLCELESSLHVFPNSNNTTDSRVQTFSKNIENMSPFIATAGKIILVQCLQQHASQIVDNAVSHNH